MASVSPTLAGIYFEYLAQTSESDLNFLSRLAADVGGVMKPTNGTLLCLELGAKTLSNGENLPIYELHVSDISSGSWEMRSRDHYQSVTARWHDVMSGQTAQVVAGDGAPQLELKHRYQSKALAQQSAKAALNKSQHRGAQIALSLATFRGDLTAGAFMIIKGIAPELAGPWSIRHITHHLEQGLTINLTAVLSPKETSS